MYHVRRLASAVASIAAVVFLLWFLPRVLNPTPPNKEQREANKRWVDTSPYWLDRQSCRWLGLCGVFHLRSDPPARQDEDDDNEGDLKRLELRSWEAHTENKWDNAAEGDKADGKRQLREIPDYVLKFAPLVHLYSGENFWPTDIADHIRHMSPYADDEKINASAPLALQNLHWLDSEAGSVYLKSNDDVELRPEWLHSHFNVPSPFPESDDPIKAPAPDSGDEEPLLSEDTTWYEVDREHPLHRIADPRKRPGGGSYPEDRRRKRRSSEAQYPIVETPHYKPDNSGYSKAPATLVLVDKGSGIVDAFWFFFYAYNLGQTVLGIRFGNHVGDWEHCMIRFEVGIPRAVFFSEHEGGQAYAWRAVEKRGNDTLTQRPVIYSAVGSHAMYAAPGYHPYVLPFKMLKDVTDRGPLWDPAKNLRGYWYDYMSTGDAGGLEPVRENPDEPTDWFHYEGPWGDRLYGLDDRRQWRLFGQYHYVTGPVGPKFKNLGRERVCQTWRCRILHSIAEGKKGSWNS
ncbi:vacuolar protein sorting-associated protein [Pseudomassariella vexata]|uniref:Vacuolar protein sorting-associated protein n=1 Tax=Pseudomassariella vexata TaxID=1141098 RepID=A0A1Y2E0E1_9PEZI|nr:vacuolar protein sorting-associated protein [Pseudomassariella vexata]ORY65008.1 vacuolar protein sorting-associated protein [Pseudomassariella vexata]